MILTAPKMLKKTILFFTVFMAFSNAWSQFDGFSHEIGFIVGPVAFQSDYGERHDLRTNAGNTGFGVGIIHYMNFAYRSTCNCYTEDTYFNDHFKLRSEISFNKTDLQHFGHWVDKSSSSPGVAQLKGMRGQTTVTNFGMQLEYYPFSIRDFSATDGSFGPFISFGGQYSYYQPKAYSMLGPLGIPQTTFPKYLDPSDGKPHGYTNDDGNVWSLVGSVGTRYKLSPLADLMVDFRWQYYFSNWVDGLNPNPEKYKENKANDWLIWFNVGYIYYLE